MLAYIFWHRPAREVEPAAYEKALERFHHSLAHRPPSGFRGSAAFRAERLGWLAQAGEEGEGGGYEDWYLLDGWSSLGVLEEAAVARGHLTRHDAVASLLEIGSGGIYRLSEGHPGLEQARVSVWVARAPGRPHPTIADLLGDGMDRRSSGLWGRCLALGPAPEYCLMASEAPQGVAPSRLPAGWQATVSRREPLFGP